ncbi:MAG: imidazole glycerol phosphate synthase subunit HisH, partial [Armatimonadota bacterium]
MILDYGVGNLQSVMNALLFLGEDSDVAMDPASLRQADRLVLPGVGAFKHARRRLQSFDAALREYVEGGRPLLGLCLGMQLL